MSIGQIDSAILAHRAWVSRFQTALGGINGEIFDLCKAGDDTACDLGRWLASESALAVLGADQHKRIVALHQIFHEIAAELAEKLNQDRTDPDNNELLGVFDGLSKQLIELMMLARKRLNS